METPDLIARPAVEVVEFTDPTIANAGIELIEQNAVKLASMLQCVRLEAAAIVFHSANQRARRTTRLPRIRVRGKRNAECPADLHPADAGCSAGSASALR
jgi:hypothetical protein